MKINIAGVTVDNVSRNEALHRVENLLSDGESHYLVTPYSEQIVFALRDSEYQRVLNQANLSLPDGIGILWAAKYLSEEGIFWPFLKTLFAIILAPKYIRSIIQEKISGSEFAYDIIKLASQKNYSLALVGGSGNVAAQSAYELKKLYPNLKINLAVSGRPFDERIVREISESNSDILILAYSPPLQEKWIAGNLSDLHVKLAMGLGGTLDYLAGKRLMAPRFLRQTGLEWGWRLITQPWRLKRIWNGVPVFAYQILRYKLHDRKNQS